VQKLLRKIGYRIERYENLTYNKRILELYQNFDCLTETFKINKIEGVFVECGYGYGRSFTVLSHFSNKFKKKIYGFDSFAGFPQITKADHSPRNPIKGEWAVRTLSEAKNWVRNSGLFENKEQYELISLKFNQSAKNPIPNQKIALLHIDLDLYDGYKYALELFWDQIQSGGIIVLDEFDTVTWPGATLAVKEFLESRNLSEDLIRKLNDKHYIVKD
jgi:hypothetical protein